MRPASPPPSLTPSPHQVITPSPPGPEPTLRCDTCGKPTTVVSRVVIDHGYNRANARPLWNCPECYNKKEQQRRQT